MSRIDPPVFLLQGCYRCATGDEESESWWKECEQASALKDQVLGSGGMDGFGGRFDETVAGGRQSQRGPFERWYRAGAFFVFPSELRGKDVAVAGCSDLWYCGRKIAANTATTACSTRKLFGESQRSLDRITSKESREPGGLKACAAYVRQAPVTGTPHS